MKFPCLGTDKGLSYLNLWGTKWKNSDVMLKLCKKKGGKMQGKQLQVTSSWSVANSSRMWPSLSLCRARLCPWIWIRLQNGYRENSQYKRINKHTALPNTPLVYSYQGHTFRVTLNITIIENPYQSKLNVSCSISVDTMTLIKLKTVKKRN